MGAGALCSRCPADRGKDGSVIIRVFCARLKPGMWAAYERLCREKSAPAMQAVSGFLTYHIGLPRADRPDDFVFVSLWEDFASVQTFAGKHWQEAFILPGEADLLEEVAVRHFDESYQSLIAMWHAVAEVVKRRETLVTTAPLSDAQWERIHPLLPAGNRRGRPHANERRILDGILYVLRTGCRWDEVPRAYGSPTTCWRRFNAWERDGTWERVWHELFATMEPPARHAWALAFVDNWNVPTKRGRRRELERVQLPVALPR